MSMDLPVMISGDGLRIIRNMDTLPKQAVALNRQLLVWLKMHRVPVEDMPVVLTLLLLMAGAIRKPKDKIPALMLISMDLIFRNNGRVPLHLSLIHISEPT